MIENTAYGAIKVVAPRGAGYNQSKLALLDTVSAELASTLRTAHTYRETNANLSRATNELAALNNFTRMVNSSLEFEEIAQHLLATAEKVTSSDHGFVGLHFPPERHAGEDEEGAVVIAHYPREIEDKLKQKARGEFKGICRRVLTGGRPVFTADRADEYDPEITAPGTLSKLGVPIVVEGQTAGLLVLESQKAAAYSDQDLDFVMGMAESAAIAISNARLYSRTQQLAVRDRLTELYDHSYFHQSLEAEVERSHRHRHETSLIMIDIDDFKSYNDRFGHLAGDTVLRWLGEVLNKNVRKTDMVARYGGEEFAILMPETSLSDAFSVAEKLHALVPGSQPEEWPDTVSLSMGLSSYPEDAQNPLTLIETADRRMYDAKRQGKNKVNAGEAG